MISWLKWLLPEAQQKPAPLPADDLLKLWATVPEHDNCFRAVNELLGRRLLESAAHAGSLSNDDTTKLRACERMECFRCLLLELDQWRRDGAEWQREQNQKR